eukprot:GFUD01062436.1.p1 GENE.GFUD01062436.1~~GFUD01062436.1.p1  ORF type:complete len:178 (-),score=53.70 GFUD01062436.1:224-757(-)
MAGLLKEPRTLLLFAKNQVRAMKDVGLYIEGTNLAAPEDTTAHVTTHHAFLTHQIVEKLQPPRPVILQSTDDKKALHLHLGGAQGLKEANGVFKRLTDVCGDVVRNRKLTDSELTNQGYDPGFVKQALEFPQDGYIPPYVDRMLEEMVEREGGRKEGKLRLKKILVTPAGWDDTRVT